MSAFPPVISEKESCWDEVNFLNQDLIQFSFGLLTGRTQQLVSMINNSEVMTQNKYIT